MKKIIFPFLLLIILLSVFPFLDDSKDTKIYTGLPWQIEVLPDGSTSVFGLNIGKSTLAEAVVVLGDDMEVAVIAASDEMGNLEMYYSRYRAGLLSGKLVLQTDTSKNEIKSMRDNALKKEFMASGNAKKYILSEGDYAFAMTEIITSITFVPAVNLDEEIIIKRFGEPAKRVVLEGVAHYQFPDKGLDIALVEDGKEVLQYVAPEDFEAIE